MPFTELCSWGLLREKYSNRAVAMAAQEEEVEALQFEEVANYQGTIEDAVNEDMIPEPALMQFNEWQSWRKEEGLRPTKRRGSSRTTSTQEEAKLWCRVMQYFHGEDWRMVLDMNQTLEDEDEEVLADQPASPAVDPSN